MSETERNAWQLDRIAWIDVETTGIDPEVDLLLEAALVITDADLRELQAESLVIRHSRDEIERVLNRSCRAQDVNDKVRAMHTENGLLEACVGSGAVSLARADELFCETLCTGGYGTELWDRMQLTKKERATSSGDYRPVIGGCSTWLDRSMIRLHLPRLYGALSRRTIDASSFKLALTSWGGQVIEKAQHKGLHRALEDCRDAIKLAQRTRHFMRLASKVITPSGFPAELVSSTSEA